MRNLFSGGLKDNPHLSYGFLTGILRVAKESIFSGLNNLKINLSWMNVIASISVSPRTKCVRWRNTTAHLISIRSSAIGMMGTASVIPRFLIPGLSSGTSTTTAVQSILQSTGSNDIIREVLASATPDIMERLELLMKGESFVTHIDTGVIYPQIQNDPSSVYSFLLVAGYLKAVSCDQSYGEDYMCEVALPNKEISFVYSKEILSQLENIIPRSAAIAIQEAIYKADIESLQKPWKSSCSKQ